MRSRGLGWRAISVRQPWAWALVNGYKPIENRDWKPSDDYRGPLLIHAGKTLGCNARDFDGECLEVASLCGRVRLPPEALLSGGYVGSVDLVGYVTRDASPWFTGPIGWLCQHGQPWPLIPRRGERGIWFVSEDEAHDICVQLEGCGYFRA